MLTQSRILDTVGQTIVEYHPHLSLAVVRQILEPLVHSHFTAITQTPIAVRLKQFESKGIGGLPNIPFDFHEQRLLMNHGLLRCASIINKSHLKKQGLLSAIRCILRMSRLVLINCRILLSPKEERSDGSRLNIQLDAYGRGALPLSSGRADFQFQVKMLLTYLYFSFLLAAGKFEVNMALRNTIERRIRTLFSTGQEGDHFALIAYQLPLLAVEFLGEVDRVVKKVCIQLGRTSTFWAVNGHFDNMYIRYTLALKKFVFDGEVNIIQHGGGPGFDLNCFQEVYSRKVSTTYCTWGWRSVISKDVSLGYPPQKKPFRRSTRIHTDQGTLVVMSDWSLIPQLGDSSEVVYHSNRERIIEGIRVLLSSLPKVNNVYIRPPRVIYTAALSSLIEDFLGKDIKVLRGNRINYRDFRAVIHTYLGTSWIESIFEDVPTMCVSPMRTKDVNVESRKLFTELHMSGVLHYEAKSLLDLYCGEKFDIETWWSSDLTSSAISQFRNNYCSTFNTNQFNSMVNGKHRSVGRVQTTS